MPYQRPRPNHNLNKAERAALLRDYFCHYSEVWKQDPSALNRKIPRQLFHDILDQIGTILLDRASTLARDPGPAREFLQANPLPDSLAGLLPDKFRVFCLLLNSLKQWAASEQAATDRYLLGGKAREECSQATNTCIITGEPLLPTKTELHHPVRDGRPPIPLSKDGHDRVEGQSPAASDGSPRSTILALKRACNRSWVHLRRGCLDHLGKDVYHSTPKIRASSRTFARKVCQVTGMTYDQMLTWLDENGL